MIEQFERDLQNERIDCYISPNEPRFKDDTLRRVLRIPKWVPFLICCGLVAFAVVFVLICCP